MAHLSAILKLVCLVLCSSIAMHATVLLTTSQQQNGLKPGAVIRVSWDDDLPDGAKQVFLWDGDRGVFLPISDILPTTTKNFVWRIPPGTLNGNRYRLQVRDPHNDQVAEFSNGFISIGAEAPLVTDVSAADNGFDVVCTPFPAADNASVTWDASRLVSDIEVLNIHFEVLASYKIETGTSGTNISLRQIPNGLAFVRVIGQDGGVVMRPLLVVH